MQLISKFNRGFRFLLCVIDIFSKYAWVVPLKDKKGITITNAFQKILKQSNKKTNKIWVDRESKFYNSSVKKWLKDNNIEMYSIHNEGKSVVSERFIRTLNDIVNEYSNTYHRTIKMKPVDVQDNTYIGSTELHSSKEVMTEILNLKLVIMLEFPITKIFLLKDKNQIGLNELL